MGRFRTRSVIVMYEVLPPPRRPFRAPVFCPPPGLALGLALLWPGAGHAAAPAACPPVLARALAPARDLLLVTTPSWSSLSASLRRFRREQAGEPWAAESPPEPAVVGRHGLAWGVGYAGLAQPGEPRKTEGDGRSPAGIYRLGRRFGRAEAAGDGILRLEDTTLCIDDPRSRHYNRIVDGRGLRRDWNSAERMGLVSLYRRGFEVLYPTAGRTRGGSCIFVHEWQRPTAGTAGCVAAAPEALERLHRSLAAPEREPVLLVLPEARLRDYRACWPELAETQPAPGSAARTPE